MDNNFNPKEYWENQLQKNWDLVGVGCTPLGYPYNKWLYRVRKKVFLRCVASLNLNYEQIRVADIGSGTGFYIDIWKSVGVKSVVGYDITKCAVKNLRDKYPEFSFHELDIGGSLKAQGFINQHYDVISAFDVLFHIVDDKRFENAIRNIYEMLETNGLFIFSDNFLHSETNRTRNQVSRSLKEIESILTNVGFQVLKRAPMFVLMNYPIDTENRIVKHAWQLMTFPITKLKISGVLLGSVLYPAELLLTSVLKESPTTEIMICRKVE